MTVSHKKKLSYFQSCRTVIQKGVYRHVMRMFKLVNCKYEDQASVRNDSCNDFVIFFYSKYFERVLKIWKTQALVYILNGGKKKQT